MESWIERVITGLVGARLMAPNHRLYAAFKRTDAQLIFAVDHWSHVLGYPGGLNTCGRCRARTQWGMCPKCQPAEFARLP